MPNQSQIYYVTRSGAHGAASQLPEGALEIQEQQFLLISENPGLIDIKVTGDVVHITPSLISYKNAALANMRSQVAHVQPDEIRLNRLARSVMVQQGCFDETSGLMLTADETLGNLQALTERLNTVLYLQHKYTTKVNACDNVVEVDRLLEAFERTLQGSL